MKRYETLLSIFVCLIVSAGALYHYLEKQHQLTEISLQIPEGRKQLGSIRDENIRLRFEIDQLENPAHLLQLARSAPYRHLRHPLRDEVSLVELPAKIVEKQEEAIPATNYTPFVIGAKRLAAN